MPYIGTNPTNRFSSVEYQDLTGVTGSPAKRGFTLNNPVGSANDIEVFVNNVRQEPSVAYTVDGTTTLTMTGDVETTDDFYVVFQAQAIGTATHPAGASLQAASGTFSGNVSITGDLSVSGTGATKVAILSHVTAHDVGGGDLTSGAFRTRPLNTEVDPDSIVTLSSNQFTLAAGTYIIDWTCDGYSVDHHVSQIYDITNSATLILGSSSYAKSTVNVANVTYGHHVFTITSTTTYELQHQCSTTKAGNGMGNVTNMSGINSTHAFLKITKV